MCAKMPTQIARMREFLVAHGALKRPFFSMHCHVDFEMARRFADPTADVALDGHDAAAAAAENERDADVLKSIRN